MKKKIALISIVAIAVSLIIWHFSMTDSSYMYKPAELPATFDEFYAAKLKQSKEKNVRPKNEERLIRYAAKTPVAILYIHGYSASRGEGEYVVDRISSILKANTYYLRLPGHGTNIEEHAGTGGREHLDEIITTLKMMRKIGDRVVVVGTSMGGLAATYVAAKNPELIDALVLSSPAYRFAHIMPRIATFYPLFRLFSAVLVKGPDRPIPPEEDNWTLYWYKGKYLRSLRQLYQLQTIAANDGIYSAVKQPVMLQYYYKDKKNQDDAASVSAMKYAYSRFNNGTPNPLSRELKIEKGDHVLLSKYTKTATDYEMIIKETVDFINSTGKK